MVFFQCCDLLIFSLLKKKKGSDTVVFDAHSIRTVLKNNYSVLIKKIKYYHFYIKTRRSFCYTKKNYNVFIITKITKYLYEIKKSKNDNSTVIL